MCSCQTQLRFLPVPSKTVFNLASLLPAHNNVRLADASELPPTWFYNCTVLEDVLAGHYSSFILQQAKDAPNTLLAGNLIRVGDDSFPHSQHWITAGQLDPHFDGFLASLLLAATTPARDLILGLDRLRCPSVFTQIATFMLRYLDILAGDARRMRIARLSRGYDPRFLWQVKAFAVGIGALFLRSYERGERVYLAMVSRGYDGRLPRPEAGGATAVHWARSALLPAAAATIAVTAVLLP